MKHPYRLIIRSDHEETPRKPDGGLDWAKITQVKIIEIVDTTHSNHMENTLLDDARLNMLRICAEIASCLPGDALEVGVYKGGSLVHIAKHFKPRDKDAVVFGFDTFTGLPKETWNENEPHQVGEFAASKDQVQEFLRKEGVARGVYLYEGLFPLSVKQFTFAPIALAHLDMDYELSTSAALEWLRDRMTRGGIIVVDDYGWHLCPGVKRAVDEFVGKYPGRLKLIETVSNQAILIACHDPRQ